MNNFEKEVYSIKHFCYTCKIFIFYTFFPVNIIYILNTSTRKKNGSRPFPKFKILTSLGDIFYQRPTTPLLFRFRWLVYPVYALSDCKIAPVLNFLWGRIIMVMTPLSMHTEAMEMFVPQVITWVM